MKVIPLHDKPLIESALRRNTQLHLYELGDLDDFFWDRTTWVADESLREIALIYNGANPPVLLALTDEPMRMRTLLHAARPLLPQNFYAHFSDDLVDVFADDYKIESHGLHLKMSLTAPHKVDAVNAGDAFNLTSADLAEIKTLYEVSYPGNWFDERMLETGMFFGVRREKKLVSIAGVHVYSPRYRVAALGNITTHPNFRGQGLATITTAKLCQELSRHVDHIGLNVLADNKSAIACYKKLGFEEVARYGEWMLSRLPKSGATKETTPTGRLYLLIFNTPASLTGTR
jgi:ribosomal protein S18 acetylase RimI-like enzyme